MFNQIAASIFLASGIFSYVLTLVLIPILERNFMDHPNMRSSHVNSTPRGGGVVFVLIGTLLTLLSEPSPARWIPILCLPLALIGLIDDFRGLPSYLRYLVQLVTAIFLINFSSLTSPIWISLLFIIMITAIINFINFMDGLDGLVAGCGVLMMASTSSWAISGAIFGFLLWNWSPAKVFMGDVGSTFIGAVFCGMLLQENSYKQSFLLLLISFPLLCDAFVCVMRRLLNGENVFKAHRKHLFQRLQQSGWSHQSVSLLYIFAVGILLYSYSTNVIFYAIAIVVCIGIYLDRCVANSFMNS